MARGRCFRCRVAAGVLAVLVMSTVSAFAAAPPRPVSGIAVLVLRSFNPDVSVDTMVLPLYAEPGLRRIGSATPSSLPQLSSVLATGRDVAVAVLQKKSDWVLIAYDDAGREGWIELHRSWLCTTWENWLKGRVARLLPGIRKQNTQLYAEPTTASAPVNIPLQQKQMRIIRAKEDWIQVLVDAAIVGWVRWRDAEGRFQVQVSDRFSQQIR